MSLIHRIVFLALVTTVLASNIKDSALVASKRIVGGRETTIVAAPFTMQFRYKDDKYIACTGSLVTPLFVVTAAHCFNAVGPKDIIVVGGVSTLRQSGVERKVVDMKMHPDFNGKNLLCDIAVLKLHAPMVGKNIASISLCTRQLKTNDYLQVYGWGLTANAGKMSDQLKTTRLPIIAQEECEARYTRSAKNSMCAFIPGSESACKGDSGGPAVNHGELCGVVSFGRECGSTTEPSVFADVYRLRSFIEDYIKSAK